MNKDKVHGKETHGTSSDINENTSVDEVKGPNLLERAKEEIEALAGAVHTKMEHQSSPHEKEDGNLSKLMILHLYYYDFFELDLRLFHERKKTFLTQAEKTFEPPPHPYTGSKTREG